MTSILCTFTFDRVKKMIQITKRYVPTKDQS